MSVQAKYDSLWETMQRDFEDTLDARTFNEFESNVKKWANVHSSEGVFEVATAIWNAMHQPVIQEVKENPGHFRDRFNGRFASRSAFEVEQSS